MTRQIVENLELFSEAQLEALEFLPEELENIESELYPNLESISLEEVAKDLEAYFEGALNRQDWKRVVAVVVVVVALLVVVFAIVFVVVVVVALLVVVFAIVFVAALVLVVALVVMALVLYRMAVADLLPQKKIKSELSEPILQEAP